MASYTVTWETLILGCDTPEEAAEVALSEMMDPESIEVYLVVAELFGNSITRVTLPVEKTK